MINMQTPSTQRSPYGTHSKQPTASHPGSQRINLTSQKHHQLVGSTGKVSKTREPLANHQGLASTAVERVD